MKLITVRKAVASIAIAVAGFSSPSAFGQQSGTASQQSAAAQQADAHFLDQFSEHHQHGIDMAKMAVEKAQNPELKEMSRKIIKDQTAEIQQMKKWRQRYFSSVPESTEKPQPMDMSQLENAKGAEFDQAFASMMSKHHQDGIQMATEVAPTLKNQEVKKFVQKSASKQREEIKKLAALSPKNRATESGTSQSK